MAHDEKCALIEGSQVEVEEVAKEETEAYR